MTYPIQAAIRARELYAAGWKPTKIRELLTEEGYGSPAVTTIQTWVMPHYAETHRGRDRKCKRTRAASEASFRLPGRTPEYQRAFMLELRMRGTPCATIARVCEVVFGVPYSVHQVRYMLRDVSPQDAEVAA